MHTKIFSTSLKYEYFNIHRPFFGKIGLVGFVIGKQDYGTLIKPKELLSKEISRSGKLKEVL